MVVADNQLAFIHKGSIIHVGLQLYLSVGNVLLVVNELDKVELVDGC